MEDKTTITVSGPLRDELRRYKRGGETWNELLARVFAQYDPEAAVEPIEATEAAETRGY